MLETVEFRIDEDKARQFLAPDQGTVLADVVRQIEVPVDDELYRDIERLDRAAKASGDVFLASWEVHRRYTRQELEAAEVLHLRITAAFEPVGEQCGTVYLDDHACPYCGFGRQRTTPLFLDLDRVPKTDFARSLAEEWIVSQRLAELFVDEQISGIEVSPVQYRPNRDYDGVDLAAVPSGRKLLARAEEEGVPDSAWDFSVWLNRSEQALLLQSARKEYQAGVTATRRGRKQPPPRYELIPNEEPVAVAPSTRFGTDPFDDDPEGEYRCPLEHVAGLAVLSELHVKRDSWDGTDFTVTDKRVGLKQGVLMPAPLIVVSSRLWRLLEENKVRGYEVEVAHLA